MVGEMAVDGLIEKSPVFDFRDDFIREMSYGTAGFIVYRPYPPVF
jgi:hypothetical protein